ncbi:unnamed protein product [Vitrella brassicaformis CCMP3155]|uniref:Uncharacterized protein n=2 Tax=Vitrella brassicaformis TaxID=1169539 RepID=A0A0G4GU68_VITBC|nr:unnamed protein product [Vitrella brassicaformis CCMP3155]|eukprot:CEM34239.1 unnamed protein product [Vitrella brassicaformis CCMP3155]
MLAPSVPYVPPVEMRMFVDGDKLKYQVASDDHEIVTPSDLGFILDLHGQRIHLGEGVQVEKDSAREATNAVNHVRTQIKYYVDIRVFDGNSPDATFTYRIPLLPVPMEDTVSALNSSWT